MTLMDAPPSTPVAAPPVAPPSAVVRLRLFAVCLGLTLLAFMQEPGRLVADTKFDLLLDPAGLMGRALHIWEPLGYGGQVQNQGYGYLFPMGPFFAIGDLVGLPDWVVQRAWWALLLCAAFLGLERLAAALGLGGPWARLIGALAFALAPRMMTTLGPISSEALPMAIAPWALLPLVRGARGGSPWRAGLLAGGVLLFAGGVNGTASIALLVLPALYLITRTPGRRRRRLMLAWAIGVVLATLWWVIPLLILSRVSPPFLDFIENASVTVGMNSLPQVLRGTDHWLAYVASDGAPVWRAGWMLVTVPIVIAYTAIVAGIGLCGLAMRRIPERAFLVAGALAGVLLLTFGYAGAMSPPWAGLEQSLLDGVLAPLRNVHKFDPILRVVLCLAVVYVIAELFRRTRHKPGWGSVAPAVAALVAMGAVGSAFPALIGQMAPFGSVTAVPDYWDEASEFLATSSDGGRALVVPGSSFARYVWGVPRDEPLQGWGRSAWTWRDAIPLAPGGTVRFLDGIRAYFSSAREMPGVANTLAAAGVKYLVIRNDLDTSSGKVPLSSLVHEALRGASGLKFVADFGPFVGGPVDEGAVVDRGLSVPYRAVEVYEVMPYAGLASVTPTASVPVVVGGPENVVDLRNQEILGAGPTILDGEQAVGSWGTVVQTDGIAVRELNPGRLEGNTSARLADDDPRTLERRRRDFEVFPDGRADAPAAWLDGVVIRSSSQASDADTARGAIKSAQAASALDGDLGTAWISAGEDGALGEWLDIAWSTPVTVARATVVLDTSALGARVTRLLVTTDDGDQEITVDGEGRADFTVPSGSTKTLRMEAVGVDSTIGPSTFAIRDIVGFPVVRRTAIAPTATRTPDITALTATVDGVPRCVHVPSQVVCTTLLARAGEEDAAVDRLVDVGAGGVVPLSMRAVPRPGTWLDDALARADAARGRTMRAAASSSLVADPEGGPRAAIDTSLDTAWVAGETDESPRLAVSWGQSREITGIRIRQSLSAPVSRPISALVTFPDGTVKTGRFDADGTLEWTTPVRASSLTISFPEVQKVYSVDPSVGGGHVLPLGVSDLRILGASDLQPTATSARTLEWACGDGPVARVGTTLIEFTARAPARDVEQGLEVLWRSCPGGAAGLTDGPADIPGGVQRVIATGGDRWTVRAFTIGSTAALPSGWGPTSPVALDVTDAATRNVQVPAAPDERLLVVRENASSGWIAMLDGQQLASVRVDGWAQGWVVPAGTGGSVTLRFGWDMWYRLGLLIGAGAVLALLLGLVMAGRWDRRGISAAPAPPRALPPLVGMVAATAALTLVAGAPGLVASLAVIAVTAVFSGRTATIIRVCIAGAAWGVCAAILALGPWGSVGYAGDTTSAAILALVAFSSAVMPWHVAPVDSWVSRVRRTSGRTPQESPHT